VSPASAQAFVAEKLSLIQTPDAPTPREILGLAIEGAPIGGFFCTNFALSALIVDMYTPQRASIQESPYIKPDTAMP
jgi:hypothetical protein